MAKYRTTQKAFWNDPYIERLNAYGKLLYLYLITSPHTSNLGILEITKNKIAFETGIDVAEIEKLYKKFEQDGKIVCDGDKTWLAKFIKHQTTTSPKLLQSLKDELPEVDSAKILAALAKAYPILEIDISKIPYQYGIDRVSIPSGELEEELEEELELEPEEEVEVEEEEKIGAENASALAASVAKPVDNCPTKQIIALYHEILPELPQVREWAETSRKMLVTRWREKKERQCLDWWREYFLKVKASDFLTGKTDGRNGGSPFLASLEWLVRPTNLAKVLNGNYTNRKPKNIFVDAAEKGYDECMKEFYGQFGLDADGIDKTEGESGSG